jgi:hypothetical protein
MLLRRGAGLWLLGGIAALVVGVRGVRGRAAPQTAPPAPASAAALEPSLATLATRSGFLFRGAPVAGQSLVYRVVWADELHDHVGASLGATGLSLGAQVTLVALTPRDGESVVEISIDALQPFSSDGGAAELPPALIEQSVGTTAHLVIHADGSLQSIRFPDAAQPGGRTFIQRLVGLMLHGPLEQPERTSFGHAATEYEDRGERQIFRTRTAYTQVDGLPASPGLSTFTQELDSGALFTFGADGALESLADTESLRLARDDGTVVFEARHGLTVQLQDSKTGAPRAAPPGLASREAHEPWEATVGKEAERRAVEARLEGLTAPILLQHVRSVGVLGGQVHDQLGFFNKATGLLKLHPEISASFPDLLHEPGMTYEGRAFALDLLASAGNDVVQSALLRALRDPRTRALPEYVQLVQRVALVSAPSNETVAFAQESFERLHATPPKDQEDADLRTASVYTLGSVAGHMAATGRRDGAERLCARIVQEMDRGTGSPKSAYITALGNAGVPAQEPLLLRLSDDGSSETRVSAINALRKYDDATTRARLLAILTARIDPARRVDADTQAEALRALMLMTPTRADVQRIAAAIVKDTLHRDLYGEVVPLFRRGIAPYPDVKAALDAMFVRSAQKDNDLQIRIDTLRAELSAKAP